MAFGVHLLARHLAKSESQVMRILQTHVDELDGVFERTTEDFLIIDLDVRTRIQYLKIPLNNLDLFDEMLGDRNFRLSLVAYNDQIEHAVERFTLSITDNLKDLKKGKEAMSALWLYMIQLAEEGRFASHSLQPFYQAMMDNLEGWLVALWRLRRRGTLLLTALRQLSFAINEMQRRVGIASRKDVVSLSNIKPFLLDMKANSNKRSLATVRSSTSLRQKLFTRRSVTAGSRPTPSSNKPLPRDPSISRKSVVRTPTSEPITSPQYISPLQSPKDQSTFQNIKRAPSCSTFAAELPADNPMKLPAKLPAKIPAELPTELPAELPADLPANSPIELPAEPITPRIPRTPGPSARLSRRLSKSFIPKRYYSAKLTDEDLEEDLAEHRPSTAPERTMKMRSASFEQLKALYANHRPQALPKDIPSNTPTMSQPSSPRLLERGETMKEQLSQYLKTDRVVDAWDNMAHKTGRTLTKSAKDWPSSIFRAKPSDALRIHRKDRQGPSREELERQWAQEEAALNTYSFKQRPTISPRIHVVSVQMILDEDTSFGQEIADDVAADNSSEIGDAESIITALPSLSFYNGPQTVRCA